MNSVSNPKAMFTGLDSTYDCDVQSSFQITCVFPEFKKTGETQLVLIMDGIDTRLTTLNFTVVANPTFHKFTKDTKDRQTELILDVSICIIIIGCS